MAHAAGSGALESATPPPLDIMGVPLPAFEGSSRGDKAFSQFLQNFLRAKSAIAFCRGLDTLDSLGRRATEAEVSRAYTLTDFEALLLLKQSFLSKFDSAACTWWTRMVEPLWQMCSDKSVKELPELSLLQSIWAEYSSSMPWLAPVSLGLDRWDEEVLARAAEMASVEGATAYRVFMAAACAEFGKSM